MSAADVTLVRIKMFLLEAEEKASEIYAPILSELWRIINEEKAHEPADHGHRSNGRDYTGSD